MGTSGSYSGSGGKHGDKVRSDIGDWINSLPPANPPPGPPPDGNSQPDGDQPEPRPNRLDPNALLPIVHLLRPRIHAGGGDGPGGGGGGGAQGGGSGSGGRRGGGPTRTAAGSARTAGRAAAGAYAFRTGDAATLGRLGLNFAELTQIGDPFEITRRIVDAACGGANSTIEDYEQRLVAADIAEWVLTENPSGPAPSPEEIVRHTIALIIADAVLTETGEVVNNSDHAGVAEQEIRDAAEALAAREQISADGVSETEFASAIERGIETLRTIVGASS